MAPVNRRRQRCRSVKDTIRLWHAGIRALVLDICWGLPQVRVRLTPWPPMM